MCSPLNSHVLTHKKNVACGHVHFFSSLLLIFTLLVAIAFVIFLSPVKKCSCCFFFQRNQSPLHFPLALATILDKINGKPKPPLPPKSRMGKWRVFALRAASSLIWGGGWGFAVPFYFVQDCSSFSVIHVSVYRRSDTVL